MIDFPAREPAHWVDLPGGEPDAPPKPHEKSGLWIYVPSDDDDPSDWPVLDAPDPATVPS